MKVEIWSDVMCPFLLYRQTQVRTGSAPFFVIGRKFAVSGAQSVEAFRQALDQAHTEWKAEKGKTTIGLHRP